MIHIKTTHPDKHTITINVEGRIDADSLASLKDVYAKSMDEEKTDIVLQLAGLTGIDAKGTRFLAEISEMITIVEAPEFLKIQLSGNYDAA